MAIAISLCVAVLITFAIFPREFKSTDLTPVIFLLGFTLVAIMCSMAGVSPAPFAKGPGNLLIIGAVMLFMFVGSGTSTFKVLTNIPTSAYKALAPAAICIGVITLLGLIAIL